MAVRRKSNLPSIMEPLGDNANQLERLIRLLALLVVKGESQPEKIKVLAGAGFTNTEIADLLGLTTNAVNVALHRIRAKK